MSIAIRQINVRNLGPLQEFQMQLGPFNLIYGPNEQGKTFLVEFMLKSLFKSAARWHLRDQPAAGRVTVTGLKDDPVSFSPSARGTKLEDYWENWKDGLPADMARLLVVKGAELSWIENRPGRIDKAVIQDYLSRTGVVEEIQGGISATIQRASIDGGTLTGPNMGEIKKRAQLRDRLVALDNLFTDADRVYSGGTRAILESRQTQVSNEIDAQERARRHLACRHGAHIQRLGQELAVLSEDDVTSLSSSHRDHQRVTDHIQHMEDERLRLEACRRDYEWLDAAIAMIERLRQETTDRVPPTFLILSILALVASIASALIGEPYLSGALTLAGLAAGGVYVWMLNRFSGQAINAEELRSIREEYERRFGRRLTNLAAAQAHRQKLQPDYYRSQSLEGDLQQARTQQNDLERAIHEQLQQLGSGPIAIEGWEAEIRRLKKRQARLVQELQHAREELARLDVDVSDYLQEDPGIEFSKAQLEELRAELSSVAETLRDEEAERNALKQRMCSETRDVISVPWSDLIVNLRACRDDIAAQYRGLTSEILAKIVILGELEQIKRGQDAIVQQRLSSETVTTPLRRITGRYHRVDLDGDRLVVSDAYQDYRLADLSTGAQEQVLLALRIGFASTIMDDARAFVILDDAFQHADWERRGRLMDQMVDLAEDGWQIIYFSMDDHIRDLFNAVGRERFGDRYRCAHLAAP